MIVLKHNKEIPGALKASLMLLLSFVFLFSLSACKNTSTLESIQREGTLKVITRVSPTTYYKDDQGPTGFEYILAQEFANELGVKLEIITVDNLDDMFTALRTNQAHIAAAGLSITPKRKEMLSFSSSYYSVKPQLLYRKGMPRPRTVEDTLTGKLLVLAGSSHAEHLRAMKETHPELSWHETDRLDTMDLLQMLDRGEIDYTIIDSNEFLVQRAFYPSVEVAFDLAFNEQLAWAMPKHVNPDFYLSVERFINETHRSGLLAHLKERFYAAANKVNRVGTMTFQQKMNNRLPKYRDLIIDVADQFEMDWRLLAAISYQESHWNPRAKSPTGVRGMMMLTQTTSREMGVTNRLDVAQSLRGGAAYYQKIYKRLPAEIREPDRRWFALAAYNVGMGHLKDAREITEFQGDDPNKWVDVKHRLPLLQRKEWYSFTTHGFARGSEPVDYVQRIRHYYEVLRWNNPTLAERQAAEAFAAEAPTVIADFRSDEVMAENLPTVL